MGVTHKRPKTMDFVCDHLPQNAPTIYGRILHLTLSFWLSPLCFLLLVLFFFLLKEEKNIPRMSKKRKPPRFPLAVL